MHCWCGINPEWNKILAPVMFDPSYYKEESKKAVTQESLTLWFIVVLIQVVSYIILNTSHIL